ncbi:hypothetical protein EDF54_2259 [Rathayibacter sp. PhB93]|uniref:hypothetical protein n=1 Tax=unclassified Rathayibacter TaxID=2609250 RepID=UPI000F4A162F|nr:MULTISPECIES: hypothetical protein [unclassified Rathayibacter]ROQ05636.1 hypothetical protein EDF54_2259 [Rathayibacter sp. PhB93]TDQ12294.1 hypothetical protein EDF17_2148 [Rathayibacter sp. PhB1]
MYVGEAPRPKGVTLIVFAFVLAALGAVVGFLASLSMWDPSETCRTRGGSRLTGERFLWNPLCSDGSVVQPMWMTLTTAAALSVALLCLVIAAVRDARYDAQESASPEVEHEYSRQALPEDDGLRRLGDEW